MLSTSKRGPATSNRKPATSNRNTVQLTVAQAIVKYLQVQYSERDGNRRRLIPAVFGIFGAWVTAVYVLRGSRALFWGPGPDTEKSPDLEDARGVEWVALVTLGGGLLLFGCMPGLILEGIDVATGEYLPVLEKALAVAGGIR